MADQVQDLLHGFFQATQMSPPPANVAGDQLQQLFASFLGAQMPMSVPLSSSATAAAAAAAATAVTIGNCTTIAHNATAGNPFNSMPTDITAISALILPWTAFLGMPDWMKLAVIGTILETCRRFLLSWYTHIKDSFFLNVVLDSSDDSFDWMNTWLARQDTFRKARFLEVSTRSSTGNEGFIIGEDDENERGLQYVPSAGHTYTLWYKNRWMQVTRTKVQRNDDSWRSHEDTLNISILTRNRKIVNSLLAEAKKLYEKDQETNVCVYVSDSNDSWRHVACRPKRSLGSIILAPGIKELVLDDARDFMASKPWYADRGIPFRRGYLLYGAAGAGKTSLIHAVAGELDLNVYILSLSRTGLDDQSLNSTLADLPAECILLMEDIDAAFNRGITRDTTEEEEEEEEEDSNGEKKKKKKKVDTPPGPSTSASKVTLSGLLNALDGVGAQEGRILFATTNRYQALDPALCRPGRMDLHIEFKLATQYQAEELFKCFYLPPLKDDTAAKEPELNEKDLADADLSSDLIDLGPLASDVKVTIAAELELPSVTQTPPTPSTSGAPSPPSSPKPSAPVFSGVSHRMRPPALGRRQYLALARRFATSIPEEKFSMATLQGYLMGYKVRPQEAVRDIPAWVEQELKELDKKRKSDIKA